MHIYIYIPRRDKGGWTQYLEDFSSWEQRKIYDDDDDEDSFGSPSLVSDAASPADNNNSNIVDGGAWNFSGTRKSFASVAMASKPQFSKRLNMKKQRYHQGYCSSSDDLEDTASSPVNSPKVKNSITDQFSEQTAGERSKMNLDKKKRNDDHHQYLELKKRGLCLMPFSMLVHYMG